MNQESRNEGKNQKKIWKPGKQEESKSKIPVPEFLVSRLSCFLFSCIPDSIFSYA